MLQSFISGLGVGIGFVIVVAVVITIANILGSKSWENWRKSWKK